MFNYEGFQFHESQVTDVAFVDSGSMDVEKIQLFLVEQGSFLKDFILFGNEGGFFDANEDGKLDVGDTAYRPGKGIGKKRTQGKELLCRKFPCLGFKEGTTGSSTATVLAMDAKDFHINPKVLLTTAQKENALIVNQRRLPVANILDYGMGCNPPTDFYSQVACSAKVLVKRFNQTPSEPYFRPLITGNPCDQYTKGICLYVGEMDGLQNVGFQINTKATYAQYRYTPYIQTEACGGVYSFEYWWGELGFGDPPPPLGC
jgi:hypothetical protein